ncbi:MAG: translation initiation factor IF-3 [Acidimicrobiaceae bacterium]
MLTWPPIRGASGRPIRQHRAIRGTRFRGRRLPASVSSFSSGVRRFHPLRRFRAHEEFRAIAPPSNEPRINDRIRAREVRLVGQDGEQIGIKPLPEALNIARAAGLDLVEVADRANPPVCRIMDYGKFKYEADQRAKESRKKSSNLTVKEMKYRPKIGPGDFDTKTRKVEKFLGEGHKVKVTIMFRGREMQHPELGRKILENVADEVDHVGKVEFHPRQDGRNMVMVLAPDKQAQARHEKERRKAEAAANEATVEAVAPAADEEE